MSIAAWSVGVESLAIEPVASGGSPPVVAKTPFLWLFNRKTVMSARAVAITVEFMVWDTAANTPKTGDSANITLRWVKDGTSAALTTTTVTEIDSTNCPGLYKADLSATETDCKVGMLHGKSSTASVYVIPVEFGFVYVPNAAAGGNGGLPTVDANNAVKVQTGTGTGQLDFTSGRIKADAVYWNGSAVATPDTAGYPKVTIKSGTGTGEVSLTAGIVADPAGVGTLLTRLSALRAGYLDNLSAGAVALASGVNVTGWLGGTPNALISGRLDVNLQAGATGVISAAMLASDAANEIADALLDRADAIETGITLRLASRYTVAAAAGVASGMATTTAVIKGANVLTTRITATVDADGNRSSVTLS